jgi:hypothetical protein
MDEIKKLAAEIVEESARRPAGVTAPAATSPGQVVLPAARPARRGPWVAVGGALVAMAILFLVWPRLRYERVQAPPSTGPEPPPVEVVTKTKPKEEPLVAPGEAPAPPPPPPAKTEPRPAIRKDETPAAPAPVATPEPGRPRAEEILAPPKPPEPTPPALETLGHEQIDREMKQIAHKVKACFDLYGIVGRILVKVKIQPDGSVGAADVEGQPSDGGECVAGAVREASFPPFRGPPMTIRYPFQAE